MGLEEDGKAAELKPGASGAEATFRAALLRSHAAGGARGPIAERAVQSCITHYYRTD
ncbi:MAG: hypothetical protein LH467_04040 [Gemmatimonadaceae bacterium]|nr:hypothetical protein [Gemmatimonadaceae bacterium]